MKRYKTCIRCEIKKKTKEFHINRALSDGFDSYCRVCKSAINKINRRKKRGIYLDPKVGIEPDLINSYTIHICEVCNNNFYPVRPTHTRCDTCAYIVRNTLWSTLNSSRKNTSAPNGVARYKAKIKTVLDVARKYVRAQQCCYCAIPFTEDNPKSTDHLVPLCMGGKHSSNNINICCLNCNRSKARLPLNEWIELCRRVVENNKEY